MAGFYMKFTALGWSGLITFFEALLNSEKKSLLFEPFNEQCFPQIETSELIWSANQLTGFYMIETFFINVWREQKVLVVNIFAWLWKQKSITTF